MALDPDRLQKPLRKLRKRLKHFSGIQSPDEVHRLRTQTRRVEAVLHAAMLDRKKSGRRLLHALAPVRKAAGKVRDMDVLVGFASSLATKSPDECLVELLEYLGKRRATAALRLHKVLSKSQHETRRKLKRCSRMIEPQAKSAEGNVKGNSTIATDERAVSIQLEAELERWPKLNAGNIHPYRIKVKELRYILQLAEDRDVDFIRALGDVKDRIGEWHDWSELASIAAKLLDKPRCKLVQRIGNKVNKEFKAALTVTRAMGKRYLNSAAQRRPASIGLRQIQTRS
jgi:CHAD domain-containing protein